MSATQPPHVSPTTPSIPDPTPASWGEPRSKTVTWFDPVESAARALTLSGQDALQSIIDQKLPAPPIAYLMGARLLEFGDGTATFAYTPDESAYNPIGMVHGGAICTLLDSALGCAVQTQLPARVGYTSIDLTVSYLRSLHRETGEVRAIGTVVKPGRRIAFAESKIVDAKGKILATATGSCLILDGS